MQFLSFVLLSISSTLNIIFLKVVSCFLSIGNKETHIRTAALHLEPILMSLFCNLYDLLSVWYFRLCTRWRKPPEVIRKSRVCPLSLGFLIFFFLAEVITLLAQISFDPTVVLTGWVPCVLAESSCAVYRQCPLPVTQIWSAGCSYVGWIPEAEVPAGQHALLRDLSPVLKDFQQPPVLESTRSGSLVLLALEVFGISCSCPPSCGNLWSPKHTLSCCLEWRLY